ncbi:hypothetical protein LCGC14_0278210 [marine sediment metagenome]|uniref:Uncharacterized protein n=1 Tax=marine sediment metagenome TaxID=412755 RepID=A0A0F9X233_9ZZZZ
MPTYSTFNPAATDTHVIIDEYGMAVIKGDSESRRDSPWRTAAGYKAWGDHALYTAAIHGLHFNNQGCIRFRDGKYEYRRHPAHAWGSDMSRDHVAALLLLVHFGVEGVRFGSMYLLRNMIKFTKWKIGPNASFTIDMWCWMKGILNKRWRTLFYMITIPYISVVARWNAILLKKGNFTVPDLQQHDFVYRRINHDVTEEQDKLRKRMFPYYALTGMAWMNHINPDSPGKRWLSKIIRGMCGAHNYLVRLLTDDMTVTKGQVIMWVEMTGAPFSVLMNEATSRDIRFLTLEEGEHNRLYGDLLITIWNEKHPEDQIRERKIL